MRISIGSAILLLTSTSFSATPIDGWYVGGFAGYTYSPNYIATTVLGNFVDNANNLNGYNVGGRLGYQSHPFRFEGEYTYLYATNHAYNVNFVPQTGAVGKNDDHLLLANIYYDFPEILFSINPFLGAGVGYSFLQSKLSSTGPFGNTNFTFKQNVFTYQGTAGLTYNFSENYALNIAYRYVTTTKANNFGKVFQAHLASAGIVYHFDQGNYK